MTDKKIDSSELSAALSSVPPGPVFVNENDHTSLRAVQLVEHWDPTLDQDGKNKLVILIILEINHHKQMVRESFEKDER